MDSGSISLPFAEKGPLARVRAYEYDEVSLGRVSYPTATLDDGAESTE